MTPRDEEIAKQRSEMQKTDYLYIVRLQKCQNGYVLKTSKGPFVFADYIGMMSFLKTYFEALP